MGDGVKAFALANDAVPAGEGDALPRDCECPIPAKMVSLPVGLVTDNQKGQLFSSNFAVAIGIEGAEIEMAVFRGGADGPMNPARRQVNCPAD
jgi:hypothetical protein